jgi:hypothetical protein
MGMSRWTQHTAKGTPHNPHNQSNPSLVEILTVASHQTLSTEGDYFGDRKPPKLAPVMVLELPETVPSSSRED